MASKVNRRGFLTTAAAGTAVGAVATVAGSVRGAEEPSLPVPDAQTKVAPGASEAQAACCTPASKLIFACSGAADVGKIADLSARKLTEDGVGKMFCLAGIGGRVKGIMETTKAAQVILAIDGCPLHCARNTLEHSGFKKFEHVCLSDLGMEKGKTPVSEDRIAQVVGHGKSRLVELGKN